MATSAGTEGARRPRTPAPKAPLTLVRRARRIYRELGVAYPEARCELDYTNPFELIVATVLSAQCTDVRVNMTTPALFATYPTAEALADAEPATLEELIRPTGFYRAKARSLLGLAAGIRDRFGGEVPRTLEELVTLPGVGRKTANVVLGNAFGVPGIPVDTHVGRLARRWGLTVESDPVVIEGELSAMLPPQDWTMFSHRTIFHARRVCHSRKPACGACLLARSCPSFGEGPTDPSAARRLLRGERADELARLAGLDG